MKKLDIQKIRGSTLLLHFWNSSLKIGRPTANLLYNRYNSIGWKCLTSLRLGNTCARWIISPFSPPCHSFTSIRSFLVGDLQSVDANIPNFVNDEIWNYLFLVSLSMTSARIIRFSVLQTSSPTGHLFRNKWK